jgi:hypothetical protein
MKISTLILLTTLLNIFSNSVQSETSKKFFGKHIPRPNVQDIRQIYKQTVSPYYEKPYLPQEVDKLTEESNLIKKDLTKYMHSAEIVGPVQPKGVEENPTMYNTVIDSRPTTITHPTPKPSNIVLRNGGGEALFDDKGDLNVSSSEKGFESVIQHGSIPVTISKTFSKEALGGNFEDPVFIHKSEKIRVRAERVENMSTVLKNQVESETNTLRDKLKIADNKKEKIRVLKDGLKKLNGEINGLAVKIEASVKDIIQAKEVGNNMNCVLSHYENTLRDNEASRLKLVDVVEIKKQLKTKLLKEIRGIRTSDNDFKALQKVKTRDLKRVIKQVRRKLGIF